MTCVKKKFLRDQLAEIAGDAPVVEGLADDGSVEAGHFGQFLEVLGAGDAGAMLKTPPWFVPARTVDCLRDIRKANLSSNPADRAMGSQRAIECADRGDLNPTNAIILPVALGDRDRTFERMTREPKTDSVTMQQFATSGLFWPTARTLRTDPRFLPLVQRLGLMDYWRATKTQPDVCETEDAPFCRELKKTLATKH